MNFIYFYGFQEGMLKGAKATNLFGIEEKNAPIMVILKLCETFMKEQ